MNYFIAFSGRTGSSTLCQRLSLTDKLGRPLEHFSLKADGSLQGNTRWWGEMPYPAYYAEYLRRTQIPKAMTGAKVTWDHWHALVAGLGELPQVDRWIWLRRRDKLAQAISAFRCFATRQSELRPGDEPKPWPDFDGRAILTLALRYRTEDDIWAAEFSRLSVAPWPVWYEQLVTEPERVVRDVARFVGVSLPSVPETDHRRMADSTSAQWHARLSRDWERISSGREASAG